MRFIRASPTSTQPGTGSAPPDRPVPDPRGTSGRPCACATFTTSTTSAVVSGKTTTAGVSRKLVSPSHS